MSRESVPCAQRGRPSPGRGATHCIAVSLQARPPQGTRAVGFYQRTEPSPVSWWNTGTGWLPGSLRRPNPKQKAGTAGQESCPPATLFPDLSEVPPGGAPVPPGARVQVRPRRSPQARASSPGADCHHRSWVPCTLSLWGLLDPGFCAARRRSHTDPPSGHHVHPRRSLSCLGGSRAPHSRVQGAAKGTGHPAHRVP